MEKHDVVIIGGGPAGLAVATALKARGIADVVVLEREMEAGGVPRHCDHGGFGWESHRRLMRGPAYAQRLLAEAQGVNLRTGTSVLELTSATTMRVHSSKRGITEYAARHVVLATGAREGTRAQRFISGTRPQGVMSTSELQQSVYLNHMKPFLRPVIIGGEWVSFSALMTCHHAGMQPQAMLVPEAKIDAPWFFPMGARLRYGVGVTTGVADLRIIGGAQVEAVSYTRKGKEVTVACDGVIVSGQFRPEDALTSGKGFDTSTITRLGNVQGALKTAGACVVDARAAVDKIMAALT